MAIPVGSAAIERYKQELLKLQMQEIALDLQWQWHREMMFRLKMAAMENWALDEIDAMVRQAKARWSLPHNPRIRGHLLEVR